MIHFACMGSCMHTNAKCFIWLPIVFGILQNLTNVMVCLFHIMFINNVSFIPAQTRYIVPI